MSAEPSLRKSSSPSVKQPPEPEFFCELCHEPASENDWNTAAQMLVCPACIEEMICGNVT